MEKILGEEEGGKWITEDGESAVTTAGGTAHGGRGKFRWLEQRDRGDGGGLIRVGVGRARGGVTAPGASDGQRCDGSADHDGTTCGTKEEKVRPTGGPARLQQCDF
jgi:hypothetical protein